MRELLNDYQKLIARGEVGRAVVTQVWGSAPRGEGAVLLAAADGSMAGSVSGGCVENAVVEEIRGAIEAGRPKALEYGVTHERAWEFGLSCGGTISLFVEPAVRPELLEAARSDRGSVVATIIGGAGPVGRSLVYREDGSREPRGVSGPLVEMMAAGAADALRRLTSRSESLPAPEGEVRVLYEVFPRRPTLLIFGGVHIATALCRLAKPLGFRVVVADGREAFLTRERFPDADELIVGWPDEVFREVGIDSATCLCLLTHDPKFDEPAIEIALRSPAAYIGVIGSRKTQALRRERLAAAGFSAEEIGRLHGPIGLDLGGREPAEIALGILAEITAARFGGKVVRQAAS
ncbi:MAG: XdhC family protein [Gemmatimonadales bacterium]